MKCRTVSLAAVVAAGALALPGVASAQPAAPTLHRTFPVASRLCARADAGSLPRRLAASADQVKAACATLEGAFDAARSDLQQAVAPVVTQVEQLRAQVRQACQAARQSGDREACQQARDAARTSLETLRQQVKQAVAAYRTAANAARKAFWATIRSLPGGAGVQQDGPAAQPSQPSVDPSSV